MACIVISHIWWWSLLTDYEYRYLAVLKLNSDSLYLVSFVKDLLNVYGVLLGCHVRTLGNGVQQDIYPKFQDTIVCVTSYVIYTITMNSWTSKNWIWRNLDQTRGLGSLQKFVDFISIINCLNAMTACATKYSWQDLNLPLQHVPTIFHNLYLYNLHLRKGAPCPHTPQSFLPSRSTWPPHASTYC